MNLSEGDMVAVATAVSGAPTPQAVLGALTRAPIITSIANPAVKAAARLTARKGRRDEQAFLVEGPQAVREGLDRLTEVFATPQAIDEHLALVQEASRRGAVIRTVTPEVLRSLADTVTPQGIVGVAPILQADLDDVVSTARFLVVLDGVSDPGNAGTIVRTADAAGADGVVFLQGTVDPFNPKAVRASTGSIFHLPIITGLPTTDLARLSASGLQLLAADVRGSVPLDSVDLSVPTALVFGGETAGLSSGTITACNVSVTIPIAHPTRPGYVGHAESLNLAAAVAVMAYSVNRAQQSLPT